MKSKWLYLFYRFRDILGVIVSKIFSRKRVFLLISVLMLCCVSILIFRSKYSLLTIRGNSMQPSYRPQDILLCEKDVGVVKRGDIVDIDTSEERVAQRAGASDEICKRVIALEGDTILFSDKEIYINGEVLHEPYAYLNGYKYTSYEDAVEYTIPEGSVYVMGDNRVLSLDSRAYGVVSLSSLNGKVIKNITADYGFTMHRLRVTIVSVFALFVVLFLWFKLNRISKKVIHKVSDKVKNRKS